MPSETLYRAALLPSADLGNATSETQILDARGVNFLRLPLPSNNSLSNRRFRIILAGRTQSTANVTCTVNLYFGLSSTIASNTQIFTSGPITVNNINSNWLIISELLWDSVSQTINGVYWGQMANVPIGPAALVNPIKGVDPNRDSNQFLQSGATYGFNMTGVFGSSSAGNHAYVDTFELEIM